MPARRSLLILLAAVAVAFLAAPAGGQVTAVENGGTNPCDDAALDLKCPDLRMAPPSDLHVKRVGGQVRLQATNHIVNVGQGHYWKYFRAARFELWTLKADGTRDKLQRIGPKLSYCLRDLKRVRTWARTPGKAVFPGCSQDYGRKHLRLGVSPGWADIYPSTYYQNWISVTGLKGCFAFVHRADPTDELIEQHEDNNLAERIIRLPARHGSVAPRGCPRPR